MMIPLIGRIASRNLLAALLLVPLAAFSAHAQQTTGEPGSPGATTTIDGKQLPPRDPKFGGVIKERASESWHGVALSQFCNNAQKFHWGQLKAWHEVL